MGTPRNQVLVGVIVGAHGIKGEVELRLLNENQDESILDEEMTVYLYPASEKSQLSHHGEEWKIQRLRFGNKVICHAVKAS